MGERERDARPNIIYGASRAAVSEKAKLQVPKKSSRPLLSYPWPICAPDPESKKIRISYKMHAEYGAIRNLPTQLASQVSSTRQDQASGTSEILALPGTGSSLFVYV
ncbi:uncharacterized protein LOC122650504 [Telopea speciosissima]|uniref:uncharacterized protein LOC122650504 n=1 Tax=Telopea speciosissima TaxID=54955 RepID=UPI001CC6536E|nr:uncharacterized protein LOC122650504 [Telopea speciosissima]